MFVPLGLFIRRVREARGLSAKEVAARAKMRPAQMTHLQQGGNAQWSYYDDFAKAIGFRSALEMFTSGGDEQTRRLLRLWHVLDDEARKLVLRQVKDVRDADEE